MKSLFWGLLPVWDFVMALFVFPAAYLLKIVRKVGVERMPFCKRVLLRVGVFPIQDHYYEPLFDHRTLLRSLAQDRTLPGIDWNTEEQLLLLKSFCFSKELSDVPRTKVDELTFSLDNKAFMSGDAEYLYNLIRLKKPRRIIEIGSGNSTLMARKAVRKNQEEDAGHICKHLCIEPYEMPWLEKTGVTVLRERGEDVDRSIYAELQEGDMLFIDSSHIIRPQGDVLFEYLELLPSLQPGVIVHVHDIFSPKDYLKEFVIEQVRFWNEQYLLEAFLTSNARWKIIGALNYLHHNYYGLLQEKCPFLTRGREPGSFYIEKVA